MTYKEYNTKSKDGLKLFGRSYLPKSGYQQALIIVHGFGEHSGRYEEMAKFLVEHKIGVYTYDQRGHGHSGGKRGHAPSYAHYMEDLNAVLEAIKKENDKNIQFCILGHSMGGNIVSNYIARYKHPFKKAVLSSPWLELAFEPPAFILFFGKIIKYIYPGFTQSTKLDANMLSKISEEVKKYKEDPLVHDRITAITYFGIYDAGKFILNHADKIHTPALLMHGGQDQITSFDATKKLATINPEMLQFKPFEKGYHELMHDEEKNDFFNEVLKFLTA